MPEQPRWTDLTGKRPDSDWRAWAEDRRGNMTVLGLFVHETKQGAEIAALEYARSIRRDFFRLHVKPMRPAR